MREHMHEHQTVRLEPPRNASEEQFPIAQMLEHLDCDNAVKGVICLEIVHITGDDI
jgi:hypothetical protein